MIRVPRNYLLAGVIVLAVVVWMLSGVVVDVQSTSKEDQQSGRGSGGFRVEVTELVAERIQRRIVAQGQVKPERYATLRAQTTGQIEAILVESGQRVSEGALLVRLAMNDRESLLLEARALLKQRQREYEAAQRLGESGLQSEVRRDEAAAELASARAALARIELDIERTRITAPFDGIVDEIMVEVGDLASMQSGLVTLVDNSPLIAEAHLSQRHFDVISRGAAAEVTLVSGETKAGQVTAIAPRADELSRTFRVEIEIPNPGGVPANTSAEIVIPTSFVQAHRISPALLELDDAGRLGVKLVTDEGVVEFNPVEIVRSDSQGIWIAGLPRTARVITAGGGFVSPGQVVEFVPTRG